MWFLSLHFRLQESSQHLLLNPISLTLGQRAQVHQSGFSCAVSVVGAVGAIWWNAIGIIIRGTDDDPPQPLQLGCLLHVGLQGFAFSRRKNTCKTHSFWKTASHVRIDDLKFYCFYLVSPPNFDAWFWVNWSRFLILKKQAGSSAYEWSSDARTSFSQNPTTSLPVYQTSKRYIRRCAHAMAKSLRLKHLGFILPYPGPFRSQKKQETCLDSHRHEVWHPCCWVCSAVLCVVCAVLALGFL